MEGWIKLYRKLMESKVFANPDVLKIWIWCLLKARHSETIGYEVIQTGRGRQVIEYKKGEFITGRNTCAQELNMNGQKVYYWLKKMSSPEFGCLIQTSNCKHYTVIRITNWDEYQGQNTGTLNKHLASNKQAFSTNNNDNNEKNVKKTLKLKDLSLKGGDGDEEGGFYVAASHPTPPVEERKTIKPEALTIESTLLDEEDCLEDLGLTIDFTSINKNRLYDLDI